MSNLVGGVGREVRDFERGARYKPSWQRKHLSPRIFSRPGRPDPGGGQIGQQAPTAKGGGRIEIIRTEGEGELARTFGALWWSGLAAGISIGFSVVSQAMLTTSVARRLARCYHHLKSRVLSWLSNSHSVASTTLHREHADGSTSSDCEPRMALVWGLGQALDDRARRQSGWLPPI